MLYVHWKNTESDKFKFENVCLENKKKEVILGITIDNKLSFESHRKSNCRKPGQKMRALSRMSQTWKQIKRNCYLKVWGNHNLAIVL